VSNSKKRLFGDDSGVIRDCLIACGIGLALFGVLAVTLWMSGSI
jgi:hypothetical protein